MLEDPEPCFLANDKYAWIGIVIGFIIMFIINLPQPYRMIAHKTGQGFSPWFFLFGVVSSTSQLFYSILHQWDSIVSGQCINGLLHVITDGINLAIFCLIFYLFLHYFPEHKKKRQLHHPTLRLELPNQMMISEEWKVSLWVAGVCMGYFVILFFITVILLAFGGHPHTNHWAWFLSSLTMLFACLLYLPQIWKTWKTKTVGALSIFALILQSPGPLLFIYPFLDHSDKDWAPVLTYMIHGTLETILLIMCIVWHYRNKRLGIDDLAMPEEEDIPSERTQLLK